MILYVGDVRRIRPITTCDERAAPSQRSFPDATRRDTPVLPSRLGVASPFFSRLELTDLSAPMQLRRMAMTRIPRRRAPLARHRPHRFPHRGRPVRDAGDPALAGRPIGDAGGDGLRGQRQHVRHGGRRSRRRLLQPRSTAGSASVSLAVLAIPTSAAGDRAQPDRLHAAAHRARPVHGVGLHADARLSRRAMQRMDAGGAFAAYITGNVASNLIGRLISAAVADRSAWRRISISSRC